MSEPEDIIDNTPEHAAESEQEHPVKAPVSGPSRMERYVQQVLSGSILTHAEVRRHYPYVLFMTVLMFLYIANGFHIQKLYRQHERLSGQIKELRARSLTLSSQRMIATRQSEIIRNLKEREIPLEELVSPPKVIDK